MSMVQALGGDRFAAWLGGVLTLLAAACGQPSGPGTTTPTGAAHAAPCIVATERGTRGGQLVLVGADGTRQGDLTRATVVAVRDNSARVSPDGKWVVFASTRARGNMSQTSLWLVSSRVGEQPRRLTTGASIDMHPVWMPNGSGIVYASQAAPGQSFGLWHVALMKATGRPPIAIGEPRLLTRDANSSALHPTVSPNGRRVVYMRLSQDKKSSLWSVAIAAKASTPVAVTQGPVDLTPTFSPDGKTIAFSSRDKGLSTHLFMINADGTGRRLVVEESLAAQTGPRFSPDGRYLFATSLFRSLSTGKALYSAISFVDLRESEPVLRSLHDPATIEVNRLAPAVMPCTLDATVMLRNRRFRENLRDAFAEEVRRRVDLIRRNQGTAPPVPPETP